MVRVNFRNLGSVNCNVGLYYKQISCILHFCSVKVYAREYFFSLSLHQRMALLSYIILLSELV